MGIAAPVLKSLAAVPIFVILRKKYIGGKNMLKECKLTKEESINEIQYKMSQKMLKILLRRGIINDMEYAQIDKLNMQTFSPSLAKVYV